MESCKSVGCAVPGRFAWGSCHMQVVCNNRGLGTLRACTEVLGELLVPLQTRPTRNFAKRKIRQSRLHLETICGALVAEDLGHKNKYSGTGHSIHAIRWYDRRRTN